MKSMYIAGLACVLSLLVVLFLTLRKPEPAMDEGAWFPRVDDITEIHVVVYAPVRYDVVVTAEDAQDLLAAIANGRRLHWTSKDRRMKWKLWGELRVSTRRGEPEEYSIASRDGTMMFVASNRVVIEVGPVPEVEKLLVSLYGQLRQRDKPDPKKGEPRAGRRAGSRWELPPTPPTHPGAKTAGSEEEGEEVTQRDKRGQTGTETMNRRGE